MKRTVETALSSLDWLIESGVPVVADADWQETTDKPCDTGSELSELVELFPMVDFSKVDPRYPDKTSKGSPYAATRKALLARAQSALRGLYGREEKAIVVVSHSGFMREAVTGSWFHNADYRIFAFEENSNPEADYQLKQWDLTSARVFSEKEGRDNSGGLKLSWAETVPIGTFPDRIPEE